MRQSPSIVPDSFDRDIYLVLDDFGLAPLADETVRDLLEILDDRYDRRKLQE